MKRALCVIAAFILLLSAVGCGESQPVPSPDNAEILSRFIDYACGEGYEFRTLDSYENW